MTINITGTNDAAADLTFDITIPPGNSLPGGVIGQIGILDPDGGAGAYSFNVISFVESDLDGNVLADTNADIVVSSTGAISTMSSGGDAFEDDRIYELTVRVSQSGAFFDETFTVITGTNFTDDIDGDPVIGDDFIVGRGGADLIFAGSGDDVVHAQQGNDHIHGGTGNDILSGGGNNDNFYFDTELNSLTNVDTILDFDSSGGEFLRLDDAIFTGLSIGTLAAGAFARNVGGDATDANHRILFDESTGNLYFDSDGTGAGEKILFATLNPEAWTGLGNADFIVF